MYRKPWKIKDSRGISLLSFIFLWYNIRVGNEPCKNVREINECLHAIWTSCIFIGRKPASENPKDSSLHVV